MDAGDPDRGAELPSGYTQSQIPARLHQASSGDTALSRLQPRQPLPPTTPFLSLSSSPAFGGATFIPATTQRSSPQTTGPPRTHTSGLAESYTLHQQARVAQPSHTFPNLGHRDSRFLNRPDSTNGHGMDVAFRSSDIPGPYGFSHSHARMAAPMSYAVASNERRMNDEDGSQAVWPVPRMSLAQHHPQDQFYTGDRPREATGLPSSQPDAPRHQGQQGNYVYEQTSPALRNPIVYSQPAQVPWGMSSQPEYAEYPTAPYVTSSNRMQHPYTQGHYFPNDAYNNLGVNGSGEAFPKADRTEHTEALWPLAPNSLEAFAGIPAPSGSIARLTLTSGTDKGKLKSRSSLPPPKQFKCSACDAIFSRNHDLKRHARIHLAVKPFPCGYCDKAFSRKDALKRHVLVKGCGIGNKKQGEGRKRSSTLSKLEQNDHGSGASRYDSPNDSRSREFSGLRDDPQHSLSRSFPNKLGGEVGSWTSTVPQAVGSGQVSSYASSEGGHRGMGSLPSQFQAHIPPYQHQQPQQHQQHFQQQHTQQYPYNASSSQYQQQVAGGMVNAFASPDDHSGSSPSDSHPRSGFSGLPGTDDKENPGNLLSRPGSTQSMNAMVYNSQPYPESAAGGAQSQNSMSTYPGFEGQGKERYGAASFLQQTAGQGSLAPSQGGPPTTENIPVKREYEPYFSSGGAN